MIYYDLVLFKMLKLDTAKKKNLEFNEMKRKQTNK